MACQKPSLMNAHFDMTSRHLQLNRVSIEAILLSNLSNDHMNFVAAPVPAAVVKHLSLATASLAAESRYALPHGESASISYRLHFSEPLL